MFTNTGLLKPITTAGLFPEMFSLSSRTKPPWVIKKQTSKHYKILFLFSINLIINEKKMHELASFKKFFPTKASKMFPGIFV